MDKKLWMFIGICLVASIFLAFFISPLASKSPDGLERVALDNAFSGKAHVKPAWRFSPLPNYSLSGAKSRWLSTGMAGLIGTILVFGVSLMVAKLVSRRSSSNGDSGGEGR
jgi:cobalt/nickel transport protein